jgi:predicted RecB family endonuclease
MFLMQVHLLDDLFNLLRGQLRRIVLSVFHIQQRLIQEWV